ncbi:hypothetical protein [Pseudomonas sp. 24 R 17]|nr:hypothetical protein [Pseudomonas sp. 24 R 17]
MWEQQEMSKLGAIPDKMLAERADRDGRRHEDGSPQGQDLS